MVRACPELVYDKDRYWCGAVLTSVGEERHKIMDRLAIGIGCSLEDNVDRMAMVAKNIPE